MFAVHLWPRMMPGGCSRYARPRYVLTAGMWHLQLAIGALGIENPNHKAGPLTFWFAAVRSRECASARASRHCENERRRGRRCRDTLRIATASARARAPRSWCRLHGFGGARGRPDLIRDVTTAGAVSLFLSRAGGKPIMAEMPMTRCLGAFDRQWNYHASSGTHECD